jgi:hypothetical protein
MAEQIAFDIGQYERLIAQVQSLATDLRSAIGPGRPGALGPDLKLQPDVQKWNVSGDMAAEGQEFGSIIGHDGDALLTQLDDLNDALVHARSVFQDASDLASVSASQWAEEFPDLCPHSGTR